MNDEALQARAAALSEPSVPSVVPAVLALLAALAGGVFAGVQLSQAFSPLVWVGFGVCAGGIAAAVWLLTRRGKAQRARQAAAESRAALDRQIEEYLPLRRAMQDAEDAARQAALSVDVYEQSCQNRARQLLRALQSYAPDTDNLPAAFTALDRMQRSLKELDAAREAAKVAAAQRELLAEHLPLQAEPLADPIPEPEQSPEEIARQLPTLQASRRVCSPSSTVCSARSAPPQPQDELRTAACRRTRPGSPRCSRNTTPSPSRCRRSQRPTPRCRTASPPRSAHGRRRFSPRSPADGTTRCCSAATSPSPPSPAATPRPRAAFSC